MKRFLSDKSKNVNDDDENDGDGDHYEKTNKGAGHDVAVFDRQHNQTLRITDEQKEAKKVQEGRKEGRSL